VALSAGTRLGPYEILKPLGAVGMGEVCRARYQRLGREAAARVLRSEVASGSARLSLFESEAPCHRRFERSECPDGPRRAIHDGVPYVVTERLEGEPLRELICRRTPSIRPSTVCVPGALPSRCLDFREKSRPAVGETSGEVTPRRAASSSGESRNDECTPGREPRF
jgi:serine/threonine protein kinase